MADHIDDIMSEVRAAVARLDGERLKQIVDDVATYCYKECAGKSFDERLFRLVLDLMQDHRFLQMQGAYHLLTIFEFDWGTLTSSQKEKLMGAIERSYDRFDDWMCCFLLSELLGEYYGNLEAFELLSKLNRFSREIGRRLLPMGLEKLAWSTSDSTLRDKAVSLIRVLTSDSSTDIRKEAAESLTRLSRKGVS